MPALQSGRGRRGGVHRDFAGKVNVVGAAGLDSGDDAGEVWRRFGLTTQEYYLLLDRGGAIVHKGPLSRDALRDRVAALAS